MSSSFCIWPSVVAECFWISSSFLTCFEVCSDHHSQHVPRSLFLAHYLSLGVSIFHAAAAIFIILCQCSHAESSRAVLLFVAELLISLADQFCLIPALILTMLVRIEAVAITIRYRLSHFTHISFAAAWIVFILMFSVAPWTLCLSFNQRRFHFLFYVGHTLMAFLSGCIVFIYTLSFYRVVRVLKTAPDDEIAIRARWKSFTHFISLFGFVLFLAAAPPVFAAIEDFEASESTTCSATSPEDSCSFFPCLIFSARFILTLFVIYAQWTRRTQRSILKASGSAHSHQFPSALSVISASAISAPAAFSFPLGASHQSPRAAYKHRVSFNDS